MTATQTTSTALRIVHLSDNYPPSRGGLEGSVQSLATAQAASGHEVHVVTTEMTGQPAHHVEGGVSVWRLPFLMGRLPGAFVDSQRVFFPPVPEPVFVHALHSLLGSLQPDVLHVHAWILYSTLGPARKLGLPVVATAHDYGSVCAVKTLYRNGAICSGPGVKKCLQCARESYGLKGIPIAMGLQLASYRHKQVSEWTGVSTAISEAGSAPRRRDRRSVTVIPSFVPNSVIEFPIDTPRPSFVPMDGPYLLFVGALGPHKGVDVLLEAHRTLWYSGRRIPLVFAGMRSQEDQFDFDRDGVHLATNVAHDDVMAAWIHAAVGVVPSAWGEPFGQVAVECLAMGTPLVVTRVGGLTDIVDNGNCGLIVDPGRPDQLAEAIRRYLDDPELAARLSAAGRVRARRYTASVVQHAIEECYRRAIAAR